MRIDSLNLSSVTSTSSCQSRWNRWLKLLHSSSSSMDVNRGADFDLSSGGLKLAWPLTRCLFRAGIPKLDVDDPGTRCEDTLQEPSIPLPPFTALMEQVEVVDIVEDPPFPPTIVGPFRSLDCFPPTPTPPALPAVIKFKTFCVS